MAKKRQSNFSIALDELINGKDTTAAAAPAKEQPASKPAEPAQKPVTQPTPAPVVTPKPAPAPTPVVAPAPKPVVKAEPKNNSEEAIAAMETMINEGTIITGSIVSKNALRILGTVEGDVSTTSSMELSGDVTGKVVAKQLTLKEGTIEGDVNCGECMNMDSGSLILGNVTAKELTLDGKVRGNIDVKDALTVQANSVVMGDIAAATIQMEQGSTVCGKVSITASEKKVDESIFARRKGKKQ
jgi:cytoskeletal protein CcmA (bactofilin family)